MTPTPTQEDAFQAVRAFLLDILPAGTEVIIAEVNRVPAPQSDDYAVMTPLRHTRLSTNVRSSELAPPSNQVNVRQAVEHVIQLNVYGPASSDNATVITTLFRDQYAIDKLAAISADIVPLYADDARQAAFVDGETQYEVSWQIELAIQVNQTVTITEQHAAVAAVTVVSVDATYPPS